MRRWLPKHLINVLQLAIRVQRRARVIGVNRACQPRKFRSPHGCSSAAARAEGGASTHE